MNIIIFFRKHKLNAPNFVSLILCILLQSNFRESQKKKKELVVKHVNHLSGVLDK
jgi:hypothetical protein